MNVTLNNLNIDENAYRNYLSALASTTTFSSGTHSLNLSNSIPQFKIESNGKYMHIIPVSLFIPFNPVTGDRYSLPQPLPGSYTSAIRFLKEIHNRNKDTETPQSKAALEMYKEWLDDKYDKINWEDVKDVSTAEKEIFRQYRDILVYSHTVMAIKKIGDKYPSTYLADIAQDPETGEYIDNPNNSACWDYFNCETILLANKISAMYDENASKGDEARPNSEMEKESKDIWKNRTFSNPYQLGTVIIYSLPTNHQHELTEKCISEIQGKKGSISSYKCFMKANRQIVNLLKSNINTKYDRHYDFLMIKVTVPEFDKDTPNGKADAAKSTQRSPAASEDDFTETVKDFVDKYTESRDNYKEWSEDVAKKFVVYRKISSEQAGELFRSSITALKAYVNSMEVVNKYQGIIAACSPELSSELLSMAMTGELEENNKDISEIVANRIIVDEDTEGYGGDSLGQFNSDQVTEEDVKSLSDKIDSIYNA